MTNPLAALGEQLTEEEKLQRYADHVQEAVENPLVWVNKLVDWGDNGLGIIHSDFGNDDARYLWFKRKYGTVQPILENRFYRQDIQDMLTPAARINVERMFALARERLSA